MPNIDQRHKRSLEKAVPKASEEAKNRRNRKPEYKEAER